MWIPGWLQISTNKCYLWSAVFCVRCAFSTIASWSSVVVIIDASWWRHQMETFSALLAILRGIPRSPVNSPHKGQWRGALMFSLICAHIYGWVNNREAGDLRRFRAHYEVSVMMSTYPRRHGGFRTYRQIGARPSAIIINTWWRL